MERDAVGPQHHAAGRTGAQRTGRHPVDAAHGDRSGHARRLRRRGDRRFGIPGDDGQAGGEQVEGRATAAIGVPAIRREPQVLQSRPEVDVHLVDDRTATAGRVERPAQVVLGDRSALGLVTVQQ